MSWPLSQDYNEAIQDPPNSFADAELRAGEVVANALGIPMPRSGNFADVYEVRCPNGSRWAVKCFTREVAGLRERYAEISKYLRQANLPFMVDFQYLEQGMRIRGQWYPILKMQWVEGFVLNEFVRDNLDKKPILNALGQIWLRMARRLREAKLAHCDLQHGNVLFVPGSTANSLAVKLIDYDGMCVPSLAGTKSGEVGHPAFQHPERLLTGAYNQEVDRFSLLSIATGLRCLSVGGCALWDKYDNGDNLLFRQSDLQKPAESPLFQELLAIREPQTQSLVKELYNACQKSLDAVPLLTELMPEEKGITKATAVRPAAAGQGPDWDFNREESGPSLIKKRRAAGKMPGWVWGAVGGAAALLLVGVGVGVGLGLRKGPAEKDETAVAGNKPEATVPQPKTKTLKAENPLQGVKPADPAANPLKPTPNPAAEGGASKRILLYSPAGDTLAVCDEGSKTWRLVNPRNGELIREFLGHEGAVTNLAISADGRRAVSSGTDAMLRWWDVQSGQTIGTRKVYGKPVVGLALSPDGVQAASVDGGNDAQVWNFEKKTGRGYHNNAKAVRVAFSPDGRYLVCGYDKSDKPDEPVAFLWPLVQGINPKAFRGPEQTVSSLAVSPDGKYLAVGHPDNLSAMTIWDIDTAKILRTIPFPNRSLVHQVLFSADSRMILGSSGNFTGVWRFREGKFVGSFQHRGPLLAGAFAPNGRQAVCAVYRDGKFAYHSIDFPPDKGVVSPMPAEERQTLVWNAPVDPDGDCSFKTSGDKLTVSLPGKDHDLGAERGQMNAPRLLFDVEGDFTVQVRVGGAFQPSATATVEGKIPVVGAGLLLAVDDKTYVRLERFVLIRGQQRETFGNWELRREGRVTFSHPSRQLSGEQTYLRLQRRGGKLLGSVSEDGQQWTQLQPLDFVFPEKVKVGVAALTTSANPFSPSFDQFQLQRSQGSLARIAWPALPAPAIVTVKPPMPNAPRRRNRRQPVPDPAEVETALKDLRARYKAEYDNGNRQQLQTVLFKEINNARNDPPQYFALLRELRDICADVNVYSGISQAQSMAQAFEVNMLEMKCSALERSIRSLRPVAADLVQVGLPLLDRAIGEENYEALTRLLKIVEPAAGSLRNDDPKRLLAASLVPQAKRVKQEYARLQPERKKLESDADDAKANLALGKFHCATRGDWQDGLPLLAHGSDAALKALAEKDLANPDEAAAESALAKDWLKYAGTQAHTKALRLACQKRAYFWYQQAALQLKGDKLKEVQRALTALAKTPELQNPWWPFGIYGGVKNDAAPGYLGLRTGNGMTTHECYRGPIDITVTARSMNTDLNIDIAAGGRLTVGLDPFTKRDRLQVFHADAAPESLGSRAKQMDVALPPNRTFTVRWQVAANGMKIWFEGKLLFEDSAANDLSEKYLVRIHADTQPLEIKMATVRPGPEK
jgi:WD40 repeat protein/regulation of enolase protein 1 (concanavalin A-like superfamily)